MRMRNSVQLIGWYGGDIAIARAAWTSTQIDVNKKSEEEIRKLIVEKLWNNGSGTPHKTPFERGIVEFNIVCDQATHIHLLKHRHANINGESARYKELREDKYYLPDDWANINSSRDKDWIDLLKEHTAKGNELYHECLKDLTPVLGRKRAKETARFFKTMNSQITLSVMMNMNCFYNFYSLRYDSKVAQTEIADTAEMMLKEIKNIPTNPFKYTLEAFKI